MTATPSRPRCECGHRYEEHSEYTGQCHQRRVQDTQYGRRHWYCPCAQYRPATDDGADENGGKNE